jgi:hypothetical protein
LIRGALRAHRRCMSMRQALIGCVFLAGCIVGGVSSQMVAAPARAGAPGARWEHHCVYVTTGERVTERLNAFGADGWELATTSVANDAGFGATLLVCLKRPAQ